MKNYENELKSIEKINNSMYELIKEVQTKR